MPITSTEGSSINDVTLRGGHIIVTMCEVGGGGKRYCDVTRHIYGKA